MEKVLKALTLLIITFFTFSCSNISQIKKENVSDVVKEKKKIVETDLENEPSKIQIPIKNNILDVNIDTCKIEHNVDVDVQNISIDDFIKLILNEVDINIFLSDNSNIVTLKSIESKNVVDVNVQQKNATQPTSVLQTTREQNRGSGFKISLKYKGKVDNLLQILSKKTGYFFTCIDERNILVEKEKIFSIVIPNYPELLKHLSSNLQNLGAKSIAYDNLTTTLTFIADYNSFLNIRKYLQNLINNASLINLKVILITVSYDSNQNVGLNWGNIVYKWLTNKMNWNTIGVDLKTSNIPGIARDDNNNLVVGLNSPANTGFRIITDNTILFNKKTFSFGNIFGLFESYGKYSILQNIYLQTLSGLKGKIEVAKEIPYIKDVSLTTTQQGTGTIGTATSDKAKSGVTMEIVPFYDRQTEVLTIDLKVNVSEVTRLITLSAGAQIGSLTQPETSVKKIETYLKLTPEQIVLLGGLVYEKDIQSTEGMPVVDTWLTKDTQKVKSKEELVILIKPFIIEFVATK